VLATVVLLPGIHRGPVFNPDSVRVVWLDS
jgi:hypothetical protein